MSNYIASFVIPAYNRQDTIDRAIGSIANSSMITDRGSYEIVVIDDASTDKTVEHVEKWKKKLPRNLTLLKFTEHSERIIARNAGMMQSQGEWIVWLDSDDEMATHFKKAFEDALHAYPHADLFNWAGTVNWRNSEGRYTHSTIRQAFQPEIGEDGLPKPFKSGGINTNAFAFKRSCLNVTGYLPPASNPYTFGHKMKGRYEEIAKMYGDKDDLGNPFGDDYAMFYMLTRHFKPVVLDQILYHQHVRV